MTELEKENEDLEIQELDLDEWESQENLQYNTIDLTVDDYNKLKKEHEKATKKLVELKKQLKTYPAQNNIEDIDALLEKKLEVKEFYKSNPDAIEFKEKIEAEMKDNPKLSIQKAYRSIMLDNEDLFNNRAVYWESFISWKQSWDNFSVINSDTYLNMPLAQRREYEKKSQAKYWEVKFK